MSDALDVLDRNACANCRRPIAKLADIGWVHGELAKYADEPIGCGVPVPVDPRCVECGQLVEASPTSGGALLGRHDHDGVPCPGSRTTQEWTT